MNSGIYRIRNLVDGKTYIGSSQNLKKRWRDHLWDFKRGKHGNSRLQRAWDKHGESSFVFEVMEEVEPDSLIEREQFYLDQISGKDEYYNICLVAGNKLGVECSEETRSKIGSANKGKVRSVEFREHSSAVRKGKPKSAETRAKISAARMGRPCSEEAKAKLRGLKHSPEAKAKMSRNHKSRKGKEGLTKNV